MLEAGTYQLKLADFGLAMQAAALALVGVLLTIGVYGAVALIVKMDDIGLHLSRRPNKGAQAFGRGLVKAMPVTMKNVPVLGRTLRNRKRRRILMRFMAGCYPDAGPERLTLAPPPRCHPMGFPPRTDPRRASPGFMAAPLAAGIHEPLGSRWTSPPTHHEGGRGR